MFVYILTLTSVSLAPHYSQRHCIVSERWQAMIIRDDPYCYKIAAVVCVHHSSTHSDTNTCTNSQLLAAHANITDSEGVWLDFQSYQHQS